MRGLTESELILIIYSGKFDFETHLSENSFSPITSRKIEQNIKKSYVVLRCNLVDNRTTQIALPVAKQIISVSTAAPGWFAEVCGI
jgi:hypothetical protein